jgi:hypothetical protein
MEETVYFHVGQAHRFDVVLGQHSADSVEYSLEKGRKATELGLLSGCLNADSG